MLGISLKISNYRSFDEEPQGFDQIPNVTVIAGRNNAGKSTLLEAVRLAIEPQGLPIDRGTAPPTLLVGRRARGEELLKACSGQESQARHFDNCKFVWSLDLGPNYKPRENVKFVSCTRPDGKSDGIGEIGPRIAVALNSMTLVGFKFRRIAAERDIRPDGPGKVEDLTPDGGLSTRLLYNFANVASYSRLYLEQEFLSALNQIFQPDCRFDSILVRDIGGSWEVFLREAKKGDVALSRSGSGLKTVILVLCHLLLLPNASKHPLDKTIFAFEELENNLHPAVLRRLLAYIRDTAQKHRTHFFLTTHSAVVIDAFASDSEAQILHVTHDGDRSKVRRVSTYDGTRQALNDLGVRASDLLQANGIIWVEGPSDHIYMNRWIELASGGALREGVHYQCVFYGGRLLARLDAVAPDKRDRNDRVSLLRVNGHAAVLIDSDKDQADDDVNDTKKRIVSEIDAVKGLAWITQGREIENYLPAAAVAKLLELPAGDIPDVEPFEEFEDYLNKLKPGAGTEFVRDKATFAAKIVPHIDSAGLDRLDLKTRLEELVARIQDWNRT